MQSLELGDTLLELVSYKAQQIKCGVVDGAVADSDAGGNTLRIGTQLGEVKCVLVNLLNLTGNGELNVIDAKAKSRYLPHR